MLSSKRGNSLLVSSMAMALVLIVSGCQKYGQQDARVADGNKGEQQKDPNAKPTDGYTPVEKTYITDITTLPAYISGLKPLFSVLPQKNNWAAAIQLKKWLFVPQDLNENDRANMGIHYLDTNAGVLAVQKIKDVYVQRDLFGAMTAEAQSDFLMTGVLTSIYLLKNLTHAELCALVKETNKTVTCAVNDNLILAPATASVDADENIAEVEEQADADSNFELDAKTATKPAEPVPNSKFGAKKPLTMADYHKIHLLGKYLKENSKDLTQNKVLEKMHLLDFDTRIFQIKFP